MDRCLLAQDLQTQMVVTYESLFNANFVARISWHKNLSFEGGMLDSQERAKGGQEGVLK